MRLLLGLTSKLLAVCFR